MQIISTSLGIVYYKFKESRLPPLAGLGREGASHAFRDIRVCSRDSAFDNDDEEILGMRARMQTHSAWQGGYDEQTL